MPLHALHCISFSTAKTDMNEVSRRPSKALLMRELRSSVVSFRVGIVIEVVWQGAIGSGRTYQSTHTNKYHHHSQRDVFLCALWRSTPGPSGLC